MTVYGYANIFQQISVPRRPTNNRKPGSHRAPHSWVSKKAMARHHRIADICAETMEVGDEMLLGTLHDMYRREFDIKTRNPFWYTSYLILPAARDRKQWWKNAGTGTGLPTVVHRAGNPDWQVFEIVSSRPGVNYPGGARTTRVRYVGPHPDIYMPQPPEDMLGGRDYR